MSESSQTTVINANTTTAGSTLSTAQTVARPEKTISITARDSVKDAGRVHVGGGMMRF
jgi:hypothetical protein